MKKFFVFALVFALSVIVSCGSGKKDEPEPADTDTDTSDTENPDGDNTDSSDTEPTDTEPTDTEPADTDTDTDTDTDMDTDTDADTDTDTEKPVEKHELIGRYNDAWGYSHIISNTAWFSYGDSLFHITQFNNEKDFIITHNDATHPWAPDKWSRFDYTEKDSKLYFCQITYTAETEDEALAADTADRTDPANSGCGEYSWSELVEVVEEPIDKDDEKIVAWATGYENYTVGEGVEEKWQTPEKALGKAVGDSFDVVVLGDGGSIVLTFDKPVTDGEGADFAVFENSFNDGFLELGTVEVSSDGEHFAAFDNYYLGVEKIDSMGSHDASLIWGFAGKFKQGKGTMFDLADLEGKPEVEDGTVDLEAITHIKIVDVIGDGSQLDSIGDPIYDPYPTTGSAGFDLDAVAVINQKE
ncbi:hypothetical protein J5681_09720 [bacterium]|nr:hypothetical protein [bacterium]